MQEDIISAVSNYTHTAEEVSMNSTAEAFVREVVVHNPYDAGANWVRTAPLIGSGLAGILVADNGHGMTRNISKDKTHPEDFRVSCFCNCEATCKSDVMAITDSQ